MNSSFSFYRTTVGKKIVMAVTGFIGIGYVMAHVMGNLLVFAGPGKLNAYAHLLKANMMLLWMARSVLIAAVILHVVAAYQLWRQSANARPTEYAQWAPVNSTWASRTMRWTGPLLLLFIVFHLLHLTGGQIHPGGEFSETDVYHNVVTGFRVWWVSAIYIAAMLALAFHMYHGVWSMFQSVGLNHPRFNGLIRHLATIITIVVVAGFISIPVAILFRIIS